MLMLILLIHHAILIEASVLSVTIYLVVVTLLGLPLITIATLVVAIVLMLGGLEICIGNRLLVFLALM